MPRCKIFLYLWVSIEFLIFLTMLFEIYNLVILLLAYLYFIIRFSVPDDLEVRLINGRRFIQHFYYYLSGPNGFESKQIEHPEEHLSEVVRLISQYLKHILFLTVPTSIYMLYRV